MPNPIRLSKTKPNFEIGVDRASELLKGINSELSQLHAQRTKYEEQEIEITFGPEVSKTENSAGENEMRQLKDQSRLPFGNTVIKQWKKGMSVLSIVDENGEEAEEYRTLWKRLDMNRKLEILKTDYFMSGCYFEVSHGPVPANGSAPQDWDILVRSPKNITTFSYDRVNSQFADYALETFTREGKEYFRYLDATHILIFEKAAVGLGVTAEPSNDWILVEVEEHKFGHCPIISIHKNMASSGEVIGAIEMLKPMFDTVRQRTAAVAQGTFWGGTRFYVLTGVNFDEVKEGPDGVEYNVADKIIDSIRFNPAGVVVLPEGMTADDKPELSQTEEGNLVQLINSMKDSLRDLAALSGSPYHLFDGEATPSTAEGSSQAYASSVDEKENDKEVIGSTFNRVLSEIVAIKTGKWKELSILWAVSEQASMNNMADTVSKLAASGIDLAWIAKNVMRGYGPQQIEDLIRSVEARKAQMEEVQDMLVEP